MSTLLEAFALDALRVTPRDACAFLVLSDAMIVSTWVAVMRLARRSESIPRWAKMVPLSWAGCRWQARAVFTVGFAGSAVPLAAAMPTVFSAYVGPVTLSADLLSSRVAGSRSDAWPWMVAALAYVSICVGMCVSILGLTLQSVITLRGTAAEHLCLTQSLDFARSPQDVLHFQGAAMMFGGCLSTYLCMLGTLCVSASGATPVVLMLVLKLCPPFAGGIAYRVLRSCLDVADPAQLMVVVQGCKQWSAVIAILVFILTLGADVVVATLEPIAHSKLDDGDERLNFIHWTVMAVLVIFVFSVVRACISPPPSHQQLRVPLI